MGNGGETKTSNDNTRKIGLAELGQHRTPLDAWVAYEGTVYDVSNFTDHPGGTVIFSMAGDDCTDIFNAFHPGSIHKESFIMKKYEIGALDDTVDETVKQSQYKNKFDPARQKQFEENYRKLRKELILEGMFNSDPMYYTYKVLSTFAIFLTSVYFAWQQYIWVGGLLLGLFWQQSGWLAHDFLHHQVFKNRTHNELFALIIADIWQGFSCGWWKAKHNTHHAVPNLHASAPNAADGDPDIDTMPLLAWSKKMAEVANNSSVGRVMISWQAWTYFPILLGARLTWAHQSWNFCFGGATLYGHDSAKNIHIDKKVTKFIGLERVCLVIHYTILLYVCSKISFFQGLTYFMLGQCSCGMFLAIVFGLGHNGMAVYPANERPDFWKLQVSTTRNVTSNFFVDWFCGGLQYQVDHHLFPSLPRHNLAKVHKRVAKFCKDEGVTYHEAGIWTGTMEVLGHLHKVSEEFLHEFPGM